MKKILIILLLLFVAVQFIPRSVANLKPGISEQDIRHAHAVDAEVMRILERSCYDCHSNHTNYPWYSNVQPLSWWIGEHIDEGKEELNFSEFKSYSLRRQYHKLEEIEEQTEDGDMPLKSYTLIHRGTELSEQEKQKIGSWVKILRDSFESHYPIDSLRRRKKH